MIDPDSWEEDSGGDPWPDEPDEFDPESIGPDPPRAPSPPEPEVPTAPQVTGEADSEVAGLFWWLVVVFNVALLGLALGPMFIYFEGRWNLGLQIFAVGAALFAYGVIRYYRFQNSREDEAEQNG